MDFFEGSRKSGRVSESFVALLKELREETYSSIEAEKKFKEAATVDPKEQLPFKRTADSAYGSRH